MSSPSVPSKTLDTPPSSDLETSPRLPPSPPQSPKPKTASLTTVDRLIGILYLHRSGRLSRQENADWRAFPLARAQFAELEARVAQDEELRGWWEDKARYDWEAPEEAGAKGLLTLRMPSAVHERFTAAVEKAIEHGIAGLAGRLEGSEDDGEAKVTAVELRKIALGRSTTLEMHAPKLENSSQETVSSAAEEVIVRRSPDACFFHPSSDMPGLVMEVSYSQQRKDLRRLAESYIIDSQHRIGCVVGLDIPYASARKGVDKSATVSVWRAATEKNEHGEDVGVCRQDVAAITFRDGDGIACEGTLELSTSDLLHSETDIAITSAEQLSIPFSDLASFLSTAQAKPPHSTSSSTKPTKFRKRKRSPEEALGEDRERKYLQQEDGELAKERQVDGEWRAHSRRRVGEGVVVGRRRSSRRISGLGVEDGG